MSESNEGQDEIKKEESTVVDVCGTHAEAAQEVRELKKSGFDTTKMSIVGEGDPEKKIIVGYYSSGDRLNPWGRAAAFLGGLWRMLFGSGLFNLGNPQNSFMSYAKSLRLGKFLLTTRGGKNEAEKARKSLGVDGTV